MVIGRVTHQVYMLINFSNISVRDHMWVIFPTTFSYKWTWKLCLSRTLRLPFDISVDQIVQCSGRADTTMELSLNKDGEFNGIEWIVTLASNSWHDQLLKSTSSSIYGSLGTLRLSFCVFHPASSSNTMNLSNLCSKFDKLSSNALTSSMDLSQCSQSQ